MHWFDAVGSLSTSETHMARLIGKTKTRQRTDSRSNEDGYLETPPKLLL